VECLIVTSPVSMSGILGGNSAINRHIAINEYGGDKVKYYCYVFNAVAYGYRLYLVNGLIVYLPFPCIWN